MKTPFDVVDDILFEKSPDKLTSGDDANPYMINKILSYQNESYCNLINHTTNRYKDVLDSQQTVDLLKLIFPRAQKRKLNWLSKPKNVKVSDNVLKSLARSMEISLKDLEGATEIFPNLVDDYKDEEKVYKKMER